MSANHSLILFEGDIRPLYEEIFAVFGLNFTGNTERVTGLAEIWECTNWPRKGKPRNLVHKAALYNGTWTAVLDREMTMILDQVKCAKCAAKWQIKIFGYMLESVSGSCTLSLYAPKKVRCLDIRNFEVVENFGTPLPQEDGISMAGMLDDGPMRVSRRLGFADSLFAHPDSKVVILGMEDPMRSAADVPPAAGQKKPNPAATSSAAQPARRPWWRIW
ncbi:MAG: hypothetical protein LBH00_05010 [Planctomycetaceae bacterium]|jgi:hypothetical protein|nr:hypothetical protein [Planctomycetaceae bacterium]